MEPTLQGRFQLQPSAETLKLRWHDLDSRGQWMDFQWGCGEVTLDLPNGGAKDEVAEESS